MARRRDDLVSDPAVIVIVIEEATESFDLWLRELLAEDAEPIGTSGAELVAQARADEV